jgi:transcriptional regulator with XRE-family HTH domain
MDLKERRKALGWDRAELARRAGLDRSVMQLVELGQWTEEDALQRVEEVLRRAEAGELDVVLPPIQYDA